MKETWHGLPPQRAHGMGARPRSGPMPMLYLHLLLGGAFLAVWGFIANMIFRDRLSEIRHHRAERLHDKLAAPHYLRHQEKPQAARVA